MKMYHECPKSVFSRVKSLTDGDYALCHLLEKDAEYASLFTERAGIRHLILDNSVAELGHSVDWAILHKWAERLRPDWVVLPDVDDNAKETVLNAKYFLKEFPRIPGVQFMGVVKGTSHKEWLYCYQELDGLLPRDSMIGFSYNCTLHRDNSFRTMLDRISLLLWFERNRYINRGRRHHLLGCCLPEEVYHYRKEWVYSMDTSKPVAAAIAHQTPYKEEYPIDRPGLDLMDYMDYEMSPEEIRLMTSNILTMRRWAND